MIDDIEDTVQESADVFDDWNLAQYGITTVRRQYRNERDAARAEAAELREKVAGLTAQLDKQAKVNNAEIDRLAKEAVAQTVRAEATEAALKEAVRHLANALEIARRNKAGAVLDEAAAWLSQHSGASNAE